MYMVRGFCSGSVCVYEQSVFLDVKRVQPAKQTMWLLPCVSRLCKLNCLLAAVENETSIT